MVDELVGCDRPRAGVAELDAVVLAGVVARGEHDARQAEAARGEPELVGAGQPDVDDVRAGVQHGRRRRRRTCAGPRAACRGPARPSRRRGRSTSTNALPERVRAGLVPLGLGALGDAADVVGLEDDGFSTRLILEVDQPRGVGIGQDREVTSATRARRCWAARRAPRPASGASYDSPTSRTASASASRSSSSGRDRVAGGQPDDLPPARDRQGVGVRLAEVVAVRLGPGGQRPEHGGASRSRRRSASPPPGTGTRRVSTDASPRP